MQAFRERTTALLTRCSAVYFESEALSLRDLLIDTYIRTFIQSSGRVIDRSYSLVGYSSALLSYRPWLW